MRRRWTAILTAVVMIFTGAVPAHAAETYATIYESAFYEAIERHEQMLSNGETDPQYNDIGYALADLTGDGVCELIFKQFTGKHYAEFWVYGYDGVSSFYMGEFSCDADWDAMYGYRSGILYRESYKGDVMLGLAEWDGSVITARTLYRGTYDRALDPPSVRDLSAYYDPDRLLGQIPEFIFFEGSIPTAGDTSEGSSSSSSSSSDRYNLDNYGYRTVITTDRRGALVFQNSPNGAFMNDYQFWNGDSIFVNLNWREDGYAIAYKDGVYGYVDATYINWSSGSIDGYDDRFNLDNYDTRIVNTGGRGTLVFQNSPNGSFMNNYQYEDGEGIFVNLYWRQDGYAIAYKDGVYGYVDASYINWGSNSSDDRFDLANYDWKTVNTGGRGALVFQTAPNGSFMYDFEFWDGDRIYVNLFWQQDGYAIAYSGGVYGYVDASYINW